MLVPSEPFRHRTKEDYAHDVLRAAILRCEMKPGDRIVIDTLSAQLGISPIPLRAALQRLQAEGLVEITPHTGAVVSELSPANIEQVSFILERLELMGFELAAQRAGTADIAALRSMLDAMEAVLVADDNNHWSELNAEFHCAIAGLSGNKLLVEFTGRTLADWNRLRRWYLPDVEMQVSQAQVEHRAMVLAGPARSIRPPALALRPSPAHPRVAPACGRRPDANRRVEAPRSRARSAAGSSI